MDLATITTLLHQNESETLDFKEQQYRFYGATDSEKSELLKDILAFANAWKTCDAHILVGVVERSGVKAQLIGVTEHLRDNDLQQFINSKTNRPIRFLTETVTIEGKQINVIQIAQRQRRPICLKQDFSGLKREIVYIRHGSSTDIAGPDEVAAMGAESSKDELAVPSIKLEFANPDSRERFGHDGEVTSVVLVDSPPPPKTPTRPAITPDSSEVGRLFESLFQPPAKELRSYYEQTALLNSLGFWVHNSGSVTATGVRAEITSDTQEGVHVLDESGRPREPRGSLELLTTLAMPSDISVTTHGGILLVSVNIGNLQPKAEYWTDAGLYVGSKCPAQIPMVARLFADNLPQPLEFQLNIRVRTIEEVYRGS